jgi:hypothetical protein
MRKVLSAIVFMVFIALVSATAPAMASADTKGLYGPKGNPSLALASTQGIQSLTYLYGGAFQFAVADGSNMFTTVSRPALATADFHSLGEMAVQSADGRNIVEVGWTVDRSLFGNVDPHLFVFHWVNGVPACYNGCGFVPVSNAASVTAGMTLPSGNSTPQFTIQHFQGNWWIGYGGVFFGFFPDALWSGAYTKAGLTQWFGEVAANSATPCTDMGNGLFSSSPSSSTAVAINFIGGPAANISLNTITNPALYTATRTSSNSVRFGGPGAC